MVTAIVGSLIYILGFIVCYSMQRIEHESEEMVYTKGDRLLNICLSILSFFWILVMLISAWIKQVQKTGYWKRPVNKIKSETE